MPIDCLLPALAGILLATATLSMRISRELIPALAGILLATATSTAQECGLGCFFIQIIFISLYSLYAFNAF